MPKLPKSFQLTRKDQTLPAVPNPDAEIFSIDLNELLSSAPEERGSLYFLGYASERVIERMLQKAGVYRILAKKGFRNIQLLLDTRDPFRHRLAIYFDNIQDEAHMLAEVVLKKRQLTIATPFASAIDGSTLEFLAVEWVCLQNPRERFTAEKPRLPGQKYPGLGMGRIALKLLLLTCSRLHLAGLLNVPEHFHNAQMYSKRFLYFLPELEGKRRAIVRDILKTHSVAEVSWAIDLGCVRENERPFSWFVSDQVVPLEPRLKEYFKSREYWQEVRRSEEAHHYVLDEACWQEKRQQIEKYIEVP